MDRQPWWGAADAGDDGEHGSGSACSRPTRGGLVIKNALIPVVTLVGLQLPIIVGDAVIMEQMFAVPSLGRLMIDARATERAQHAAY